MTVASSLKCPGRFAFLLSQDINTRQFELSTVYMSTREYDQDMIKAICVSNLKQMWHTYVSIVSFPMGYSFLGMIELGCPSKQAILPDRLRRLRNDFDHEPQQWSLTPQIGMY